MKSKILCYIPAIIGLLSAGVNFTLAQGTAFTYQGRLIDGATPAAGNYDFRFRLCSDSLGNTLTGAIYLTNAVPVTNGLFTVALDFGANFPGANRWLEVDVKTNGADDYAVLAPLQAVTPAPYAMFANNAGNAVSATTATSANSVAAANISGTILNSSLPSSPNFSGAVTAVSLVGSGAGLVKLNASELVSGTVPLARLSGITSNELDATTWQLLSNLIGGNPTFNNLTVTNTLIMPKFAVSYALVYSGCSFPRSGTFISHGGTVMLFCSASCYTTATGYHGVSVSVDGMFRGVMTMFFNLTNTHMTLPGNIFVISGLAAGSHTVTLDKYDATVQTDCGDNNQVTALELPF